MNANSQTPQPGKWARRILRSTLPIGLVLLVVWVVYVAVALGVGVEQFGFTIVQALLGLLTSITLIISGYYYRRGLGRR